ncbi:sigma-70 family RNA polymerase sigma factor [Jeotgalibacillus sp. ET6]|uniref:RNA polymerase sigma factor n=1 Tax=Jeotgalibacillus sp. ET6 TaxID=3037260 RepID=UPI002418A4AA|nr:sigma-70 family RNA polymerase sigma factor [Jeotgalibacillus sp. ET6]MDG5472784.1 sigma-70 family RNA polymerase sigma factor [Jeotgalibacillus sp. ET6]
MEHLTVQRDIDLYERMVSGDQKAFENLYMKYEKLIYSFAYRMTQNHSSAEEVVQEVFLKLWKKHAQYLEEKGKFSSWLLTITRNASMDLLSRQTKHQHAEFEEHDSLTDTALHIEGVIEKKEQSNTVHTAIAQLNEEQQTVIRLCYLNGMSHEKISSDTGVPLGTVKSRIRLALKHLKSSQTLQRDYHFT